MSELEFAVSKLLVKKSNDMSFVDAVKEQVHAKANKRCFVVGIWSVNNLK